MKIAGAIVEINPLTKGHKYFINQIKKDNPDYLVFVMSPSFVMRGEPAIFSKEDRTKMLLDSGVDIVLSLPTPLSLCSADYFAKGGINILKRAGITDLYFGAESPDLNTLLKVSSLYESRQYKKELKKELKTGISFKDASKKALQKLSNLDSSFFTSNNMLALSYLKEIKKCNIKPHVIERVGASYNSLEKNNYESATKLRNDIKMGDNSIFSNLEPHFLNGYEEAIKYSLFSKPKDELRNILNVSEGIENRIKKADFSLNLDSLINSLITKRDTESKIKRIFISSLLNITKDEMKRSLKYPLHILGFNETASKYIKEIKKHSKVSDTIKSDSSKSLYKESIYQTIYDSYKVNNSKYKPIIKK